MNMGDIVLQFLTVLGQCFLALVLLLVLVLLIKLATTREDRDGYDVGEDKNDNFGNYGFKPDKGGKPL